MVIEIRTYRLHPGTTDRFLALMRDESAPLLAAAGITVLDAGASLVREDGHEEAYLIRRFDSVAQRNAAEDAFYSGSAWRDGPRDAVLACIDDFHTIVLELPDAVATGWTTP